MSNSKGSRRERELVNTLDEHGFAVMRAPASGAATDRDLPDVLAGNGKTFYAIEAKSSAGAPIYIDGAEITSLVYFAQNFGATARIGVRFDQEDWYFFHPSELYVTDSGNYRVKKETALRNGENIAKLSGQAHQTRLANDSSVNDDVATVLESVKDGSLSIEEGTEVLASRIGE